MSLSVRLEVYRTMESLSNRLATMLSSAEDLAGKVLSYANNLRNKLLNIHPTIKRVVYDGRRTIRTILVALIDIPLNGLEDVAKRVEKVITEAKELRQTCKETLRLVRVAGNQQEPVLHMGRSLCGMACSMTCSKVCRKMSNAYPTIAQVGLIGKCIWEGGEWRVSKHAPQSRSERNRALSLSQICREIWSLCNKLALSFIVFGSGHIVPWIEELHYVMKSK